MEPDDPRPPPVDVLPRSRTTPPNRADKYLNRLLHDSRMIGLALAEDTVTLQIDDYDVWRLSTAYGMATGHSGDPLFPVTFEFRGVTAWAVYQTNPLGQLGRLKHSLRSNLGKLHELSGDLVLRWDEDRIIAFFELRVKPARFTRISGQGGSGTVWHEHGLLLAIDARELVIVEGQRKPWEAAFGVESVKLLNDFMLRRVEFGQGPYSLFEDLVREHLGKHVRLKSPS